MNFPPLGVVLKALIFDLFGPLGAAKHVSGETDSFILAALELIAGEGLKHKIMLTQVGWDYETENWAGVFPYPHGREAAGTRSDSLPGKADSGQDRKLEAARQLATG